MFMYVFYLALGGLFLWRGADWIVDSAAAVARRFAVSELVIGLTIVAMGTSLPEFLVTFSAALKGVPSISLANVVGSNIFNLGIILGLLALIRPIESVERSILRRDGPMLLGVVALITLLCQDLTLGHFDGILLTVIFLGYLVWMLVRCRTLGSCPTESRDEAETEDVEPATWKTYALLPVGIVAVGFGSQFMVDGAIGVARFFGVSEWLIGLTIVAAGTSLPELVTCLAASVKGKNSMLLGNLVGSDFFNFSGVLGVTALVQPLAVREDSLITLQLASGAIMLLLAMLFSGRGLSRKEGGVLLFLGLLRWGLEILGVSLS